MTWSPCRVLSEDAHAFETSFVVQSLLVALLANMFKYVEIEGKSRQTLLWSGCWIYFRDIPVGPLESPL